MPSNRVTFSFFRYPRSYSPAAFVFMGFRRLFIGRDVPAGDIRLLGCGGGDGFSIWPDLRTYCLMSALPDPADDRRLRASAFYRKIARPSQLQLHIELEPVSGHGRWDGAEPFRYSGEPLARGPIAVLTHARVRRNRVRAFWRRVPAIRRHLQSAPGCRFHIGFGEHPLLTLATFSIWDSVDDIRAFAYHQSPHHQTLRTARREDWLSESIFVRFRVLGIEGDLDAWPHRLLQ
jgi:spheroidene monooxygenase